MDFNIRAGMRVLYKHNNSNWLVGEIKSGAALIDEQGLFLPIWTKDGIDNNVSLGDYNEDEYTVMANINDIFFDAFKLEDWIKDYPKYFMTKEEYLKFLDTDDFERGLENAWVSDGEYGYYPVSKYNRTWIEKQPFKYIVRSE